jgi:hypothetical protein
VTDTHKERRTVLLFDRVLEAAYRHARWFQYDTPPTADEMTVTGHHVLALTEQERAMLAKLEQAVVFDINDVTPLLGDWERDRNKDIPRQPPHEVTWVEWSVIPAKPVEGGQTLYVESEVGALIYPVANPQLRHSDADDHEYFREIEARGGRLYGTTVFRRITDTNAPHLADRRGQIVVDDGVWLFSLVDHGTNIREYYCYNDRDEGEADSLFGLPIPVPLDRNKMWGGFPWQPFMAFALLHCKNIVTEDNVPDARTQRQCERHGNPPRATWKTLRIEVPQTVHAHQHHGGEGSKKCFHLCRGHFKNLTHPRYKHPGWHWWPSHWKGDPALGSVDKHYKMVPKHGHRGGTS